MANGIYAAAAGMAAQETRSELRSRTTSRTSTRPGYKSERVGFEDLLLPAARTAPGSGAARPRSTPAPRARRARSHLANPLALAINGPGFFQVRRPTAPG